MTTVRFNPQLPGYEVLAELGHSNARILKARHVATGDIVAIKQFAFAADPDTLRRFEQESVIMTRIDHPNVVRVREVQLDVAMPFLVMDYVEGGDLRGLLRQGGHLDIPTTLRLGLQLTGAFRAIHPRGIIHRDIKPENILYRRLASNELHFLLTDFGIAKLRDAGDRTQTGQSLMTYEYAAPEQFDNPRSVTVAADYYALGVVLYECLAGHVPFALRDETGLVQFMQQVLTAPLPTPTLPAGEPLPPSLRTLLTHLLRRDANVRLQNPDELELLLEQSRVEWLRAHRTAPIVQPIANQTIAGPTVAFPPIGTPAVAAEPEDESASGSSVWVWVVGALVVTALLIALTLNRFHRPERIRSNASTVRTDSVVDNGNEAQSGSSAADTTTPVEDSEPETQPMISPQVQSPAPILNDSAGRRATLPDSTATVPPDSAQ